jgi:hypothetical protein
MNAWASPRLAVLESTVSKSNFTVTRVTTTGLAVALMALTGCSLGLQTEGSADFEQIEASDLGAAVLEAIADQSADGPSFADAITGPSNTFDTPEADLNVEEEDVHPAPDTTIPETTIPNTQDPIDEEPAAVDEVAEAPAEEPQLDEEDLDADKDPTETAEEQTTKGNWSTLTYAAQDGAAVGMFTDIQMTEDGAAMVYGFATILGDSVELQLLGHWRPDGDRSVVSFAGSAQSDNGNELSINAEGLGLSPECPYAMGGTLAVRGADFSALISFSQECDPCFVLSIGADDVAKVCTD